MGDGLGCERPPESSLDLLVDWKVYGQCMEAIAAETWSRVIEFLLRPSSLIVGVAVSLSIATGLAGRLFLLVGEQLWSRQEEGPIGLLPLPPLGPARNEALGTESSFKGHRNLLGSCGCLVCGFRATLGHGGRLPTGA